jgi:hypothetical protein
MYLKRNAANALKRRGLRNVVGNTRLAAVAVPQIKKIGMPRRRRRNKALRKIDNRQNTHGKSVFVQGVK